MPLFCSHCGTQNDIDAQTCKACDARVGHLNSSANSGTADAYKVEDSDAASSAGGSGINSFGFWAISGVVCAVYLVNPTMGVFEFIPDNLPIIGNLDEAAATTGLLLALSKLGLNPFWKKPN